MGKIRQLREDQIVNGGSQEHIYPVTHTKAVYSKDRENLQDIIDSIREGNFLKDGSIKTRHLKDKAVTTSKLDDGSVDNRVLAINAVKTENILDNAVSTSKIANQSVTKEKIADQSVDNSKLSPSAVTYDKLKDKSVITEKLNDRAVTTEKVEEKAITNTKLGDQSVDGRVVREASIESKHIGNNAVSTPKIASRSVTNEKIAHNSVSRAELTPDVRNSIDKKADAEQVNNSLYDLEKKIGERFVVEGDVTNLPDEEDLTSVKESEHDVLKLADRSYAPHNFSGKGYKILRKNIKPVSIAVTEIRVESSSSSDGTLSFTINGKETQVVVSATTDNTTALVAQKVAVALQESMTEYDVSIDASLITLTRKSDGFVTPSVFSASTTGVVCTVTDSIKREPRNILTPAMINQANTIYEIRYEFNLNDTEVAIPEGCVLKFEGGAIINGTLQGNNTEVINNSIVCFKEILFKGSFEANRLSINCLESKYIDNLYSLLSCFKQTEFYLSKDYTNIQYNGVVDGISIESLNLDGNGYTLDVYSFPVHNLKNCNIKNITINAHNNVQVSWKQDPFNFGLIFVADSILSLTNVTITGDTTRVYLRNATNCVVRNCTGKGSYFYFYDCGNVDVENNKIEDANTGLYFIGVHDESKHINIVHNYLKNISGGGIILSGGLKYNINVSNNILKNVSSGGAETAGINMHPKGKIIINNNNITLNPNGVALDIDASREDMFDINTDIQVNDNIITAASNTITKVVLVGLGKLLVKGNYLNNCVFTMWDNPNTIIEDNTIDISVFWNDQNRIFNYNINKLTSSTNHIMWFKHNLIKVTNNPEGNYVKTAVTGIASFTKDFYLYSLDNTLYGWSKSEGRSIQLECVLADFSNNAHIFGDMAQYDKNFGNNDYIKGLHNTYLSTVGISTGARYAEGLKGVNILTGDEYRGTYLGIQDIKGNPANTRYFGTTAQRPTSCLEGTKYYDTTLHKNIFARGTQAKLNVAITGDLVSTDNSYTTDIVTINLGSLSLRQINTTNSLIPKSVIFEHYLTHIRNISYFSTIVKLQWSEYIVIITSPYVGAVGTDYSVVHSNPNGYTTEHTLVSDGSIYWVDEDGNPADAAKSGNLETAKALTGLQPGFQYMLVDSSIQKPIYWTGTKWVDSTGADV